MASSQSKSSDPDLGRVGGTAAPGRQFISITHKKVVPPSLHNNPYPIQPPSLINLKDFDGMKTPSSLDKSDMSLPPTPWDPRKPDSFPHPVVTQLPSTTMTTSASTALPFRPDPPPHIMVPIVPWSDRITHLVHSLPPRPHTNSLSRLAIRTYRINTSSQLQINDKKDEEGRRSHHQERIRAKDRETKEKEREVLDRQDEEDDKRRNKARRTRGRGLTSLFPEDDEGSTREKNMDSESSDRINNLHQGMVELISSRS